MNIRRVLSILACILLIALVAAFALMHWDQWEDHIYVPPETMESVLDNGSPMPLFSLEKGGGYGRIEDTATVTWTVYADGTADAEKLGRRTSTVQFSEEDFETLCSMITLKKVRSLRAIEDWEVMDGGSTSIIVYDTQGQIAVEKGGYCVKSERYTDLFRSAYQLIRPYLAELEFPQVPQDSQEDLPITTTEMSTDSTTAQKELPSSYVTMILDAIPDRTAQRLFTVSYDEYLDGYRAWTVYADGTLVRTNWNEPTGEEQLSEDDLEKLRGLVTADRMKDLMVKSEEVMDGCNQSIILYDKNGDFLMSRGGHVPFKGEFTDLYYQVCEVMVEYIPL